MPNPNKLTVDNIGYLYPSTRQGEGHSGAIVELIPDDLEPHVKLKRPDGPVKSGDFFLGLV